MCPAALICADAFLYVPVMPDAQDFSTSAPRLLRLTPVEGAPGCGCSERHPPVAPVAENARVRALVRWQSVYGLLLFVVLPTLAGIVYLGWMAADRFKSKSRFVVRIPGAAASNSALAGLMQNAGIARGVDNSFIVRDYLNRRDAMAYLRKNPNLDQVIASNKADFLWRYPNFFTSATDEGTLFPLPAGDIGHPGHHDGREHAPNPGLYPGRSTAPGGGAAGGRGVAGQPAERAGTS